MKVLGPEGLDALGKAAELMKQAADQWREANQRAGRELSWAEFQEVLAQEDDR